MSRSLVTTRVVPPRLVSAATVAVARKSSASYPGAFEASEPERPHELGEAVELFSELGRELAPSLVAGEELMPVGRNVQRVPAGDDRPRPLGVPEPEQHVPEPDEHVGRPARAVPNRLGQGVERPMGERVAVDRHQRAGRHGRRASSASRRWISDQSRSVPSPAASKESGRPRSVDLESGGPKRTRNGPEAREPVHAADRSRHERRVRRERDARRSAMRARLDASFAAPCSAAFPPGTSPSRRPRARCARRSRTPRRHPRRGARETTRAPRAAFAGPASRARTSP